jgi:hypothetical protein
MDAKSK